jgi:hypothetical protein
MLAFEKGIQEFLKEDGTTEGRLKTMFSTLTTEE